jgi:hypothetical protein
MRPRTVALTTTLLLAGVVPSASAQLGDSAKLTPNGLGPIRVGMTESEIARVADRPIHVRNFPDSPCGGARLGHKAFGLFTDGRLRRVSLGSAFYSTRSGLRVGMPQAAIRERYGAEVKRSPHAYDPAGFYFKVTRGNRRLVFETDGEEITVIHGGAKPEVDYIEGCA